MKVIAIYVVGPISCCSRVREIGLITMCGVKNNSVKVPAICIAWNTLLR